MFVSSAWKYLDFHVLLPSGNQHLSYTLKWAGFMLNTIFAVHSAAVA